MSKITFTDKNLTVDVEKGISILDAAMRYDVPLYHTCGGNCSCSTCRVRVLSGAENLSKAEDTEKGILDAFDLLPPHRLGCQAQVLNGDVTVEIPKRVKAPRPNKTPPLPKAKK